MDYKLTRKFEIANSIKNRKEKRLKFCIVKLTKMKKTIFYLSALISIIMIVSCGCRLTANKEINKKNEVKNRQNKFDTINWSSELIMKVETKAIILYNLEGEAGISFKILEIVKGEFGEFNKLGNDKYFSICPEWDTLKKQYNFPIMPNKIQFMGFNKTNDKSEKNVIIGTNWKFDKAEGTRSITDKDFFWDKDWPGFTGKRLENKKK
jgi:hypothetical protein